MCESRSKTVKNVKRQVRTAAGTSEATYQQELPGDYDLDGEIQGKGDAMCLWTLLSHTILDVHKSLTPGITLTHAAHKNESTRSSDAYVDDTDNWAEATKHETEVIEDGNGTEYLPLDDEVSTVIGRLQQSAQTWAMLIALTGRLVAFHKCSWQVLA